MKNRMLLILLIITLIIGCSSQQKNIDPIKSENEPENIVLSLDSQLDDLTRQIVNSLSQENKSKIAVMEFSDLNGNITEFGKYLAEELTTRLFMTKHFVVVERQKINEIMKEQKLGISGLIDDESAISLGKIFGVDAITSGSITDLGEMIKINARLISTETGEIFSVASVKIEKDNVIENMMKKFTVEKNEPNDERIEKFVILKKSKFLSDKNPVFTTSFTISNKQKIKNISIKMDLKGVVLCDNSGKPYYKKSGGYYYDNVYINDMKVDYINKFLKPIKPTKDYQSGTWQTININIPLSFIENGNNTFKFVMGKHKSNYEDLYVKNIILNISY
ncbi:MAG: CsgG/HfaB family protein [Candidatus Cloacimonetes bacterium]|nr:CsgG/HfaB family protein [Candidatus Cloacimonadota bacterium]